MVRQARAGPGVSEELADRHLHINIEWTHISSGVEAGSSVWGGNTCSLIVERPLVHLHPQSLTNGAC